MKIRSAQALTAGALLLVMALAGCTSDGGAAGSAPTPTDTATSPTEAAGTGSTAPSQAVAPSALSASLTWPKGVDDFALNICSSIGEHTIQGGGNADGWNLVLDANLLNPGDTGTLTVSQKSDMTVVYDARVTSLTVSQDGSFTGSGQDASQAPFTITGTCDAQW